MMAGVTVRRLVSDHALVVALRIAHRLPEEVPQGSETGKATYAVDPGEDEIARSAWCSARLGGRARDDLTPGPASR
jgi:hypothetical protein